jgi:hypothetical protein
MSDVHIDLIILTGAAVAANLFCILYWITAPWYRSEVGRAAWSMTFSVALLLDTALVAYWFHWTVPAWVAHVIYVVIFVACWLKFGAWLHEQVLKRRRRQAE